MRRRPNRAFGLGVAGGAAGVLDGGAGRAPGGRGGGPGNPEGAVFGGGPVGTRGGLGVTGAR
ncbi:MAG TPA: hypothetical protein VGJ53_08695, partial [Micromonosporaceae bacterium]